MSIESYYYLDLNFKNYFSINWTLYIEWKFIFLRNLLYRQAKNHPIIGCKFNAELKSSATGGLILIKVSPAAGQAGLSRYSNKQLLCWRRKNLGLNIEIVSSGVICFVITHTKLNNLIFFFFNFPPTYCFF